MTFPTDPPTTPPAEELAPPPPTRGKGPAIAIAVTIVIVVVALAAGLIAAGSSSKSVGPFVATSASHANTHWHAALGVYDCDHWMGDGSGDGIWNWPAMVNENGATSPGRVGTNLYAGLHSHDDGVIHMEPATQDDAGKNATVGRYFKEGGWQLSATGFSFLDTTVKNGDKCGSAPGALQWSINGKTQTGNPANYKLYNNDVIVIAFMPSSKTLANIGKPPSVANLPGASNNEGGTPTTVGDASGKPCVKQAESSPLGAPTVPVKVGPPPTHLVVKDLKTGTGAVVPKGATVTVQYIGVSCSTGKIFDSSYSRGQPATFPLSGVIPGWSDGIPGMRVGGVRLLGIPSKDAYGAQGSPPVIAPNETLWFVVDMVKVGAAQPAPTTLPPASSAPDYNVDPSKTYTASITTNFGTIVIALDTKHDPIGAGHFIKLAQAGVYNGSRWHRVAQDFVIQGGAPHGDPNASYGHAVIGETPTDHYPLGSIAAAKTPTDPPGTFDSQFFIVTSSTNGLTLSNDYARFGTVKSGMDVVQKIAALAPAGGDGEPTQSATIDKVAITIS